MQVLQRRTAEGLAFWRKIVTGDEVWLHVYDPEIKQQSTVWKRSSDPTPVKPRQCNSAGKVMAALFFDSEGIFYRHMVPQGETINALAYRDILERLGEAIRSKPPSL